MSTATIARLRWGDMLGSGATLPVLLLLSWELGAGSGVLDTRLWSSPLGVLQGAIASLADGTLPAAVAASLRRDLMGFAIGGGIALVAGLAMGRSPILDRLIGPSFHSFRQIALFAWAPFISLWLGTGEAARVAFIALASAIPVLLNTFEGVRGVDRRYLEAGRVLGLTPLQSLRRIALPAAMPRILTGVRLGLIYAWLATVGSEYLFGATLGVGALMMDAREAFRMDLVILGMIVVGGVGLVINTALLHIARRLPGARTA